MKKFKVMFRNGQQTMLKANELYLDQATKVWIKVTDGKRERKWENWQVDWVKEL